MDDTVKTTFLVKAKITSKRPDDNYLDLDKKSGELKPIEGLAPYPTPGEILVAIASKGGEVSITDKKEVAEFTKLGEQEYLRRHNIRVYNTLTKRINELASKAKDLSGIAERDLAESYSKKILQLQRLRLPIHDWLRGKGYSEDKELVLGFPEKKSRQDEFNELADAFWNEEKPDSDTVHSVLYNKARFGENPSNYLKRWRESEGRGYTPDEVRAHPGFVWYNPRKTAKMR